MRGIWPSCSVGGLLMFEVGFGCVDDLGGERGSVHVVHVVHGVTY